MKKKFFICCIVGLFLLISLNAFSSIGTTGTEGIREEEKGLPVMWIDNDFMERYENDYNSEEAAFIDPALSYEIHEMSDYSILDLLYYIPQDRDQGWCSNCWAWPSTSVLEIALRVQLGILENRLSVQYMNTCGELYPTTQIVCCEGGNLNMFASFYRATGIAIPWSNENAYWQDYVAIGRCEQVECNEISKDPNYPISSIRSNSIKIRGVPEQTAIDNIKNILHQKRGVYFGVFFADETNIFSFRDFWRYENEDVVYDLDYYAGHPWVEEEAAGHALLVVGYHDDENTDSNDYWIMLNSWGTTTDRPNGLVHIDMHMNYSLEYSDYNAFSAETLNVSFGGAAPTTSITGPTSGRINTEYSFDVSATDPQGDDVYLYVNWGDGTATNWLGPYASGEIIQQTHSFPERINYTIKAKAKDIYENEGKDQPLLITIPYSYSIPFLLFWEEVSQRFPTAFPLLRHLMGD